MSLRTELHTASLRKQQADGRVLLRRLNRVEYENTLHDLLGINLPLQHYLPEDSITHGFDNVSEGLRLSMLHMGQFLEAADAAIDAAVDLRDPPKSVKRRLRYHDEESVIDDQKKVGGQTKAFRVSPESVVIFDDNSPTAVRQFTFRDRGRYRFKISASAVQAAGRPAWLKVYATNWKVRNLLGYFDLPAKGRREIELIANIEAGWLLELKPYDTNYDPEGRALYGKDAYAYQGRGISIDWIDVEGPLPMAGSDRPGLGLSEELGAEKLLLEFATRAFRRPVTAAEVERYVKLAAEKIGLQTRLPSLVLGTGSPSLSYNRGGVMIPAESRPSHVFAKLFLNGTPAEVERQVQKLREGRSIMDTVQDEARSFIARAGATDRDKLNEYFASVRELEKRLLKSEAWVQKPKPKIDAEAPRDIANGSDLIGRMRLLFDLVPLALQTDSTRLITIFLQGANAVPPVAGVTIDHHNLSHHGQEPEKIAQLRLIEIEQFRVFGGLMEKLKTKQEGGVPLLDDTMVLFGSNLGNANSHDTRNLPILLAGGGFKLGRHTAFDARKNTPLCNLYLSILQRLGVESDAFGSSTGTLTGLA